MYTAGQAPRGLVCPVHRILCTGPGNNTWRSKGISESIRGVQEASKSDQEHFVRLQEPPRALQEAFNRLLELTAGVQEVSKSDQLSFFSSKSLQERSKKLSRGFKKGYALIAVSRLLPASRIV